MGNFLHFFLFGGYIHLSHLKKKSLWTHGFEILAQALMDHTARNYGWLVSNQNFNRTQDRQNPTLKYLKEFNGFEIKRLLF